MKAGLVTSTILHALLLGFGLFTLSAPRAFEVMDIESFPVDIVPIEQISQVQVGDREEPVAETPAPTPTTRPEPVENAEQVGDNTVDTTAPPTPDPKPRPVETASLPEPAPEPAPLPEPVPEPEPAVSAPEPVPATEVTPEPQPKQEVEPDPAPEPVPAETAEAEDAALPDSAPRPETRPQPPQAQTAKAPERKDAEKPAPKKQQTPAQEKSDDVLQDVAALLNQDKASGGGAKRSTEQAALGGKRKTGEKLSQSELDALRNQFSGCWSIPAGAEDGSDLRASIRFNVAPGGRLEGMPQVITSSGNRQFDESAVRAVQKCDQKGFILPQGKEDVWAEVVVNFDPSDMF